MVMRAHAAMSLISNNYIGLDTTSTNGTFFFFFCLSLHECPGGTGSLMRQTLQPFRDSKLGTDTRTGGISHCTGFKRLAVRDCAGVVTSVMSRRHMFRGRVSER
jgi:hypothetical protein